MLQATLKYILNKGFIPNWHYVWFDGCTSQFKSSKSWYFNMTCGCVKMWNFSMNGHVKRCHDGVGAVIKMEIFFVPFGKCHNPTLREVWGRHSHSRKWDLRVLRDSRKFRVRLQGSKHLALRCSLYRWKGLEV